MNSEEPEKLSADLSFQGRPTKGRKELNGFDAKTPQPNYNHDDDVKGADSLWSVGWRGSCADCLRHGFNESNY